MATLGEMSQMLAKEYDEDESLERILCTMLQVCHSCIWLRDKGIDHIDHERIIFYREDWQDYHRILFMPTLIMANNKECAQPAKRSLAESILAVINMFSGSLTADLCKQLTSIVQLPIKGMQKMALYLEYLLYGPLEDAPDQDLVTMQRWLDVERASVLNRLIKTQGLWRVKLSVLEEFQLSFLVYTAPNILLELGQMQG